LEAKKLKTKKMKIVNVDNGSEDQIERTLSNLSLHRFWIGRERMPSVQIFIEWLKFPEGDPMRDLIMNADPLEAKKFGADAKNDFVYWNGRKIAFGSDEHHGIIEQAIRAKFRDNQDAMEALIATGKKIVIQRQDLESPETSLPKELFCKILMAIRKENTVTLEKLVVLKYADNECYVQVVSVKEAMEKYGEKYFGIDLAKRTWRYGQSQFKIGSRRECERGSRGGVIGVFNRFNIDQLDSLAHAAVNAVSSDHIFSCD